MMITNEINIILIAVLIVAVVNDIRFQKIPNLLTYPTMIIGIAYHSVFTGFEGFLFSMGGIGLGLASLIMFHFMGGMGAGDVKLMGAIGALLGPVIICFVFILAALTGGIYALVILAYHGHLKATMKRYGAILKTLLIAKKFIYVPATGNEKKLRLYYGVPIAAGAVLAITLRSEILTLV